MNELYEGGSPWLTDTLWMGVNKVRSGAAAMLVGTPDMLADALKEYVDLGVRNFILSGWAASRRSRDFRARGDAAPRGHEPRAARTADGRLA